MQNYDTICSFSEHWTPCRQLPSVCCAGRLWEGETCLGGTRIERWAQREILNNLELPFTEWCPVESILWSHITEGCGKMWVHKGGKYHCTNIVNSVLLLQRAWHIWKKKKKLTEHSVLHKISSFPKRGKNPILWDPRRMCKPGLPSLSLVLIVGLQQQTRGAGSYPSADWLLWR